MAAVVAVGEKDIDGIELKEIPLVPADAWTLKGSWPAGNYQPGETIPLTRVSGIILEELTKMPIPEGNLIIKAGDSSRTIRIGTDGRFETLNLLPGTYDLRLEIFGHATAGSRVTVEDKDLDLELTTRRLY